MTTEEDKQYKISCNFLECNNIGQKRYLAKGVLFSEGILMVLCDAHINYVIQHVATIKS